MCRQKEITTNGKVAQSIFDATFADGQRRRRLDQGEENRLILRVTLSTRLLLASNLPRGRAFSLALRFMKITILLSGN